MKNATPKNETGGAQAQILALLVETDVATTLDELDAQLPNLKRKKITSSICRHVTNGYVVRKKSGCYQVTAKGKKAYKRGYTSGPQGPLTGERKPQRTTLRSRVWKALRLKKRATLGELIAYAALEDTDDQNALRNASRYIRGLRAAGVVKKLARREPGTAPTSNGHHVYLLVDDLGPEAPYLRRNGTTLCNPNTGEEIEVDDAPLARGGAA
ncbi:hypothetical protein QMT40_003014 [Parvibaculaceae bacterium PLY_AMNH_Bact1]|nr:hypothetical protein QMT40_003014 [Parvibaculaceae bacterium PLY_AMNH_Bact1]